MTAYVIRRLLQAALVLFVMSLLVFFGVYLIGDPVEIFVAADADQVERARAIAALGLDKPIWEQYTSFVQGALGGDFGRSFVFGLPAVTLILQRLPATLELAFAAVFLTVVIGLPLGLWAGLRPDGFAGRTILAGSILGFSLPTFWVGIMLILVFAVQLGWLPSNGRGPVAEFLGIKSSLFTVDGWRHLILPAINLALLNIALMIRLVRAGVREVLPLDYIRFARAKGLSWGRIVGVHVMKNIMLPVVTVLGLELGAVIAFAVVTESIFNWPGMGKLIIDSIQRLDRPVVVAYLMVTVAIVIFINLVVDVVYSLLDPRIRLKDLDH
ncbi:MAG: ABC transporter permease [Alphaproteobacteria bacterium]|jgi:peptide/nickel transport system permease protein|nr:ABC transporter permease [Alphaproteobacteria bacterium]